MKKTTVGQLKRVIHEAMGDESNSTALVRAIRSGRVHAEDLGNDEVYIMTGEAEGITVKVLRRGR